MKLHVVAKFPSPETLARREIEFLPLIVGAKAASVLRHLQPSAIEWRSDHDLAAFIQAGLMTPSYPQLRGVTTFRLSWNCCPVSHIDASDEQNDVAEDG